MITGKRRGVSNGCSSAASHPALATITFTTFTLSASECDTEYNSYLPLLSGPPLLLRDIISNLTFSHHEERLLALSQLRGTVINSKRKRPEYLIQMLHLSYTTGKEIKFRKSQIRGINFKHTDLLQFLFNCFC